ncbi:MAG: hypothetical protein HGB26_07750 [Desulfobulbaceae bacterium]|nr:hypothetical protein [Desulfobulbaceae bacterium]
MTKGEAIAIVGKDKMNFRTNHSVAVFLSKQPDKGEIDEKEFWAQYEYCCGAAERQRQENEWRQVAHADNRKISGSTQAARRFPT